MMSLVSAVIWRNIFEGISQKKNDIRLKHAKLVKNPTIND